MLVIGEEVEKVKDTGMGKKFGGVRVLWTSVRRLKAEQILEGGSISPQSKKYSCWFLVLDMCECIKIKRKWLELISGYEVVGQEDLGRTLKDLLPELT
jgi:adenosine deaminase CECR1